VVARAAPVPVIFRNSLRVRPTLRFDIAILALNEL
jgi:hypothetical protein